MRRVPGVEVADDGDALGVRRPDREAGALDAVVCGDVRAEHLADVEVPALGQQMQVEVAQGGAEPVGVIDLVACAMMVHAQPVWSGDGGGAGEEPGRMLALEFSQAGSRSVDDFDRVGTGDEGADCAVMRAEQAEGITVPAFDESHHLAAHAASPRSSSRAAMVNIPLSGMPTQAGRLATSYLTS